MAWAALAIGAAGVAWRLILMLQGVPPSNSDEATQGLAAMHVAEGRDFPVFFYGQHYMGTIEPFLAAPLVALFGPSTLMLRVPTLLLYVLFLVLMFQLSRRLFSPVVALGTVVFLSFGADRLVKNELIAGGGYPEVNPMLAALFLIGLGLATHAYRREAPAFACWGVLSGLILWTHWLAGPFLLAAAFALILPRRRTWNRWATVAVVSGLLIGAAPLIWDNLSSPLKYNSISVFLSLSSAGGDPSLWERIYGGAVTGLPLASGLCSTGHCEPAQLWWAPVYLMLIILAGVWAKRAIARDDRDDRARNLTVLTLSAAAILTVLYYASSGSAASSPLESARYLHYLLVATPLWIWALWRLAQGALGRAGRLAAVAVTAGVLAFASFATVDLGRNIPRYAAWEGDHAHLVAGLRERGVSHVYGGYWTCNRLIFAAREEIMCGVVDHELRRGLNRYPPYWDAVVAHSRRPAFLVLAASEVVGPEHLLDEAVRRHLEASGVPFTSTRIGAYLLYEAQGEVTLP